AGAGYFLDIDWKRAELARYGLSIDEAQTTVQNAIGGENVTTTIEGRERYPVNVRYMPDFRSDVAQLRHLPIPTPGTERQVSLGQLATITPAAGPAMLRSENGLLAGYVYVDLAALSARLQPEHRRLGRRHRARRRRRRNRRVHAALSRPRVRAGTKRRAPSRPRGPAGSNRAGRGPAAPAEVHDGRDDVSRPSPGHVGRRHRLGRDEANRGAAGRRYPHLVPAGARRLPAALSDLEVEHRGEAAAARRTP